MCRGSGASWCSMPACPAQDRAMLRERYGFLEFARPGPADGPGAQLAHLRDQIDARFWLHLGQGWRFFAPENLITRLTAVLEAEPQVFQVGINFTDAVKLTGASAAETRGTPHPRCRPLRPHRCDGQRPGDVRHHTPGSGRRYAQHRPRPARRTRTPGGRRRTTHRQPRRSALHHHNLRQPLRRRRLIPRVQSRCWHARTEALVVSIVVGRALLLGYASPVVCLDVG